MQDQWKGVIAGAGFFAQYHADAWQRLPQARIVAVADPDVGKAEEFARRWGIPKIYADAARMLADERPGFLDIVTGPDTHRSLAELAAGARIHVITQKPMAPDWGDCVAMVETCERAGVRLFVHENWRWQPWYRELRRLVDEDRFGRVFHIAFRLRNGDGRGSNPYTLQPYFKQMRRFLIYETLVHFLDTFRFLAGEIRSINCRTARVNPLIAGEDYALLQLSFAGGAHGLIDANRISGPLPLEPTFGTLWLEGERAMARMDGQGRIFITDYGGPEQEHEYAKPAEGYRGDSVRALQNHILECLRGGTPCESEGRAYLATVRAVLAAYESAETGNTIHL